MTTPPEPEKSRAKRRTPRKTSENLEEVLKTLIESEHLRFESREIPLELQTRLSIEEAKARHELWRDKVMTYACLVALGVLGIVSVVFLFLPGQSSESRTWAAASLSAIVSGVVNYSLGRTGKAT